MTALLNSWSDILAASAVGDAAILAGAGVVLALRKYRFNKIVHRRVLSLFPQNGECGSEQSEYANRNQNTHLSSSSKGNVTAATFAPSPSGVAAVTTFHARIDASYVASSQ